ncbi:MAG: hypoxanthine phosphoribosyltransferase [Bryobacterales bacterium]|nr:hypoxanthine phosphoribosyltransferase [Bryobacterales bacterium]
MSGYTHLPVAPNHKLSVLIPRADIDARILELGKQIRADYGDRPLYMVGILKGACVFLGDLIRAIPGDVRFDFMGISSYGKGKTSSGEVKVTKDLDMSLEGVDVLIVEDIVDTGVTLTYLAHVLQQRRPRSIQIAALLDKPSRRMRPVQVKYVGFTIPDQFVVGFGLDYAEAYRNLPEICIVEES